jgi:hypothetical protein
MARIYLARPSILAYPWPMPKPLPSEDKGMSPQEKYFYSLNAIFVALFGSGTVVIVETPLWSVRFWFGVFYNVAGLAGLIVMAGDLLKDRLKITISKVPVRVSLVVLAAVGSAVLAIQLAAIIFSVRGDLDNYVMPRRLSNKQAEVIKQTLLTHPPPFEVKLYISGADHEAFEYASQLRDALIGAGWKANIRGLDPWDTSHPDVFDRNFFPIMLANDRGIAIRPCVTGGPKPASDLGSGPESLLFGALNKAKLAEKRSLIYSWQCKEDGLVVEVAPRSYYLGDDRTVLSKLDQWWNEK